MLAIAIDGACRRPGAPDCVSAGGVFIQHYNENLDVVGSVTLDTYEENSTSQRGEMLALLTALEFVLYRLADSQIITDSAYLFNAMTKSWVLNWSNKGWVTATGESVKNQDLWEKIDKVYQQCIDEGVEILFYHVKGHAIPFGKVTAKNLLIEDDTGQMLFNAVTQKFRSLVHTKEVQGKVRDVYVELNGFLPDNKIIERFVVSNIVADAVATQAVEAAIAK